MKNKIVIVVVSIVLLLAIGASVFLFHKLQSTNTEMGEMIEQMNYEKEKLQLEYDEVAQSMEGFSFQVRNDSILKLLDKEQARVKQLMEELRSTKVTNANRIAELRAELASVRKVLLYYINQVDSLNQVNQKLTTENNIVKQQIKEQTQKATVLAEEKEKLSQTVALASQLTARDIKIETFRDRSRPSNKVSKVISFKVTFTLDKNITTSAGEKTVYMCLFGPDDRIMTKSSADKFRFENRDIPFSARKHFEYSGEEVSETLWWNVEEVLLAGTYRVDLFVDEHIIGSQSIKLEP